jgi:hypothetical protein
LSCLVFPLFDFSSPPSPLLVPPPPLAIVASFSKRQCRPEDH